MRQPNTAAPDSRVAARLYGLGVISGVIYAELKQIATRLNAFSDAPAANALSPEFQTLQRAAVFCGFWGVGNYLGALRELAQGIEANPPLSVQRTEYLERVKTLAAGINALGLYVRDVHQGVAPSSSALNEQFAKVIRKARPVLLELSPAQLAPIMFMPVPPSLEVEARWRAQDGASHDALLQTLEHAVRQPTPQAMARVAQCNPYASLSGLFEAAACQAAQLEEAVAGEVAQEYERLLQLLRAGIPLAPALPDSFLFSRLLYQLAFAAGDEPQAQDMRKRYSLRRPRSAPGSAEAVSMLDVARKFAAAMAKFRDAYLQAALSNTPAPIVKLAGSVAADSNKLESPAFSAYATALHEHTRHWTAQSDLCAEDWTQGAVLLLLLQESAESWGNQQAQDDLAALADLARSGAPVGPCVTMQQATKIAAIKKACAALLAEAGQLKVAIEGALRSVGDTDLNDSQRQRVVEVAGERADVVLRLVAGFCWCVGLPAAAVFAEGLSRLVLDPMTWATAVAREPVFDGLSRVTLFLGRVRPGSLIDIQPDELGPFAQIQDPDGSVNIETQPHVNDPVAPASDDPPPAAVQDTAPAAAAPAEPGSQQDGAAGDGALPHSDIDPDAGADRPPTSEPDSGAVLLQPLPAGQAVEFSAANDEVSATADEVTPAAAEITSAAREDTAREAEDVLFGDGADAGEPTAFSFGDDGMPPPPARRKEALDIAVLRAQFIGAAAGVPNAIDAADSELLNVMFEESDQCMSDIEGCLAEWGAPDASPRRLVGTVSDLRRHIHTLKGVSRTCGLEGAGELLHAMETRLEITADDGLDLAADLQAYIDATAVVRRTLERARSQFAQGASGPLMSDEDGPYDVAPEHVAHGADAKPQHTQSQPPAPESPGAEGLDGVDRGSPVDGGHDAPGCAAFIPDPAAADPAATETVPATHAPESQPGPAVVSGESDAQSDSAPVESHSPPPAPGFETMESAQRSAPQSGPAPVADAGADAPPLAETQPIAPAPGGAGGSVRIPVHLAARVGDASGHLLAASRRSLEIGERAARSFKELEGNIKRMGPVLRELDILAAASIPSASAAASHGFDPLELDRYTSLQELVRRLKESFEDSLGSVDALAQDLRLATRADQDHVQLSDDLQRESSELTLVAVASQRNRLEQVVARACKDTGKAAALTIEPGCRVPAAALDKLMPVFEHLLRNAVAHGIEAPQARALAGKPATGAIAIARPPAAAGAPDATVLRICVRDDGAGIDHERVLAAALKRGIAARGEHYSDEAIRELLFVPGFSTASTLSQVSGRGVGLDVVRAAMSTFGGMVNAGCAAGGGAEFVLTLPTDTSSMSVLPVSANGYHCLLPLAMVARIVPVSSSLGVQIVPDEHQVVIGGEQLELVHLATRVPSARRQSRPGRGHLVLMREASATKAVLVDTVGAQTRVIVRQLGPFVRDVPGIVAGTAFANGGVALVLNPLRLREMAGAHPAAGGAPRAPAQVKQVMVVDDSSTVRLVTSRFLRRVGYEPIAARDGLEALQMIAKGARPAALLCDIEMPGMGGFDLISEIRQKPDFAAVPIVVISSRTATKHRERARQLGATAYLSKPYEDAQLLEILRSQLAGESAEIVGKIPLA